MRKLHELKSQAWAPDSEAGKFLVAEPTHLSSTDVYVAAPSSWVPPLPQKAVSASEDCHLPGQ